MLEFMGGQGLACDDAAADRNWMLLASALNRRFNDLRLQTDPRLRRVVADARWAASSVDASLLVPKGDANPRRVLDARGKHFKDSITPAYVTDAERDAPKRKPPPKKTTEKKATKKKKKVSACFFWRLECYCRCRRRTSSPPSRRLTKTGRPRCSPSSLFPRTELIVCRTGCRQADRVSDDSWCRWNYPLLSRAYPLPLKDSLSPSSSSPSTWLRICLCQMMLLLLLLLVHRL